MSSATCFGIPQKQTADMDFTKKARQVAVATKTHAGILDKLTRQRIETVRLLVRGSDEASEKAVNRYVELLAAMLPSGKAPQLRNILFYFWSTSIGQRSSHACPDVSYEVASILFNSAAADTTKAATGIATAGRSSTDRLEKDAYQLFCKAAGKFEKASELMKDVEFSKSFPEDMSSDFLSGLKELCLAQAQECSLAKALSVPENRNKHLMCRLGIQSYELYSSAYTSLGKYAPARRDDTQLIQKLVDWCITKRDMLKVKTFVLYAINLSKDDKMGEAKSATEQAAALLAVVQKSIKERKSLKKDLTEQLTQLTNETERCCYNIKRDSQMIYGRSMKIDSPVPPPEPQVLARPIPFAIPDTLDEDWSPAIIQAFHIRP